MVARAAGERHRASTPLELLFDLCFVVAVARAGEVLHHGVSENHAGPATGGYLMVFFAIWWAWMNFTWFASAYDTDDGLYRVTTLVQIAGALVLAAGVSRGGEGDFTVMTWAYVVMRLAMVTQWLRAARTDAGHRRTALRYAGGITLVQAGWLARLALPESWSVPAFIVLALADVAVPVWAERSGATSWHPRHITERYGLFTIIVLGETVLAATTALESAVSAGHGGAGLVSLAVAGALIVFGMWWLYFDHSAHARLTSLRRAFVWGYGHYLVFAAAAAVGAGLAVSVDYYAHTAHVPALGAGYSVAIPVALYLLTVWILQARPDRDGAVQVAYPVGAVLVLVTPFGPAPVHVIAGLIVALVAVQLVTAGRARSEQRGEQ
jgi:low temperature requirement protein LtrA